MADKAEAQVSGLDTVKLGGALVLLVAGVVAFYYYADHSLLYRVLGLIAVALVAGGVALTTAQGRRLVGFLQDSRTEVRKMVWPSRTETVQTTLVVLVMVVLIGILLWLLDMLLGWAVRFLIGHGG